MQGIARGEMCLYTKFQLRKKAYAKIPLFEHDNMLRMFLRKSVIIFNRIYFYTSNKMFN